MKIILCLYFSMMATTVLAETLLDTSSEEMMEQSINAMAKECGHDSRCHANINGSIMRICGKYLRQHRDSTDKKQIVKDCRKSLNGLNANQLFQMAWPDR